MITPSAGERSQRVLDRLQRVRVADQRLDILRRDRLGRVVRQRLGLSRAPSSALVSQLRREMFDAGATTWISASVPA